MPKTILYIGNNFSNTSKYQSTMETLSSLLASEEYKIIKSSSNKNKLLRLLSMCLAVVKHRKVDYILIDTFSTSAFYFTFFTSQLARFLNKKYIPILHGGNLPFRLKKSPFLSKLIFNNSYKNIAPSNYLKTAFVKEGFIVDFIPNILQIENYIFKQRKIFQPKLLWVRAFAQIYNPTMAIEVLKIVKKEYSKATLCMIGPVKEEQVFYKTKELVKKYNLEDSVELTGVLPKEKWLKKSEDFDIFINTTNVDNTPVSVMEAMALGLTVVSTNVGGIPFLINDKMDGVLVEPEKPQQMAYAILHLFKEKPQKMIENARKKAESFSWNEVKHKWLNLLR